MSASRDQIRSQVPWNRRLVEGLKDALLKSFTELATSPNSPLRFSWPVFLPCLEKVDTRFRKTARSVLRQLRDTPLVVPETIFIQEKSDSDRSSSAGQDSDADSTSSAEECSDSDTTTSLAGRSDPDAASSTDDGLNSDATSSAGKVSDSDAASSTEDSSDSDVIDPAEEGSDVDSTTSTERSSNSDMYYLTPSEAFFVDAEYRHKGESLITTRSFLELAASRFYKQKARAALADLGVGHVSEQKFIKGLQQMLQNDEEEFQGQTAAWHERLAFVLRRIVPQRHHFEEQCSKLRLIPLDAGQWGSADMDNILLPGSSYIQPPKGLTISSVLFPDPDEKNHHRRQLFKTLGVKVATSDEICKAILRDHKAQSESLSHLFEHAMYLYNAKYDRKKDDKLLFLDSNANIATDHDLVVPFGEVGSWLHGMLHKSNSIHWLHSDYETNFNEMDCHKWMEWLLEWPGVELFFPIQLANKLSPCLQELHSCGGSEFLLWYLQSRETEIKNLNQNCIAEIGVLKVDSSLGQCKLGETTLPSLSEQAGSILPVLDLANLDGDDWSFLSRFGVQTVDNVELHIKKLQRIKAQTQSGIDTSVQSCLEIYEQVGNFLTDKQRIR